VRATSSSRRPVQTTAGIGVFAGILLATIVGCATPATPPSSGASPAGTDGRSAASAGAASVTSVADVATMENALAEKVADAAGIPTYLGADEWAWANKLLHDKLAQAGQNLTITGDAALTASVNAGPPRTAVDGGGGLAISMAAVMLGSMVNVVGPNANLGGPLTSTETKTANGETTTATFSMNIAMSTAGSTIDGDVSIGVDVTVTDAATGAVKKTVTFKSSGNIKLEFCPDASGKVHGHVKLMLSAGSSGAGSASTSVDADIEGTVGDDASLNQITASGQSTTSTTAPGGSTRSSRLSGSFTSAIDRNGNMTGNRTNEDSHVLDGPNDLTQAEADTAAGQIYSAANVGIWVMGDAAQKKWRSGACVEIRATEQSRDVKKNETVQFEARVWHKIENVELHKPIVNTFTGKRSVDPVDIPVPAPVTISYKAGPMLNDTGTIRMTTTSNRGIGVLALTFTVKGGWIIDTPSAGGGSLKGQKCGDPTGIWIVNGIINFGSQGVQKWTVTIDANGQTGTFKYTTKTETTYAGVTVTLEGDAHGTATLSIDPVSGQAHMELTETFHEYRSWVDPAYKGSDNNAPLEGATFDWDVGGTC
jgi:hypothetical protein